MGYDANLTFDSSRTGTQLKTNQEGMMVAAAIPLFGAGFALSPIVQAIKSLYGIAVEVNEFIDHHIESMKASENPTISRTGRVLEGAKYGFGIGYATPVVVIAVGQLLLGNTLKAATTVSTAAVLSNPIAMTCAAIGAIYYGWAALTDEERNEILQKLSNGLAVGIELIKSMIHFVINQTKELLNSENIKEIKNYIGSAASYFGKSLRGVTGKFTDKFYETVEMFSKDSKVVVDKTIDDPLMNRLRILSVDDIKTILVGGLRIDEKSVSEKNHEELIFLCSKELRSAAGSSTKSVFRDDHDFPYKQIVIDVADKLAPGHTPMSWTHYKLDDNHAESEIEEYISERFESLAKEWWGKLSEEEKATFVDGIQGVMESNSASKEIASSGAIRSLVTQQVIENIVQAGIMQGLSKIGGGGLLGAIGGSLITQLGWVILLQTVGWMGGMKIAVFGIGGVGTMGAAVTGLGAAAIGGLLSLPGLIVVADGPAYRKTIPTVIMLIARHKAALSAQSELS